MQIKNKAKLYQLPANTPQRAGVEITDDELTDLISSTNELMDESVRQNFSERMQEHVGADATYTAKALVRQGLKIIYDKFKNSDTNESEKKCWL